MPRASSSTKRQQGAASNHNSKHENGLVGPGKRIVKQKSQNHLDGSPKLPATNAAPLPPSLPSSSSAPNGGPRNADDMAPAEHRSTEALRRGSLGTYSETSSADSLAPSSSQGVSEDAHRRIDVNAAKNTNVHRDTGPFDLALTVLRSCPLHDTIAILIILMQLSPLALSSIYMLFTLLTFVPPVTTSSGLSITEIFDGLGTPNLWTLIGLDLVFFFIWIMVPLQDLILDFAQVVIALTLGGGANSRAGTTHNIFLCVGIVIFSHFGRHPALSRLSNLRALLGDGRLGSPDADNPLESSAGAYEKRGPYGRLRSVLAIHILVQGIVRYVREWYLRREKRDSLSQSQPDPEAGKVFPADSSTDGGFGTPDTEPNPQPSSSVVSTKKRRKQSAQVRIRQPLWAALASTKIVMVKEYELSHAATESAGSNATDIHNLGNAPFNTQPEQIWICYVGCDEVSFNTSSFASVKSPSHSAGNGNASSSSWIDIAKPFYVRVNNAVWQPTRIMPIDNEEESQTEMRWTGDIYGLTPMSNYEIEFVSTRTGEVLFATSVRTVQAKFKDSDVSVKASAAARSQYRHESPATTLKTSIAGLEVKLADEKARLKALRKENNRKANQVRKDIERLTTAVQSAGGNDEKLRQKIAQNTTQQKQAEQSIVDLEEELKELETVPDDVLDKYRKKQSEYNSEKAQFDGARASFKSFKSSVDQEVKALEEEQSSLQAKRTKIAARINKVENEHARLTDANARGLDEAERRRQERLAFEAEIAQSEQRYSMTFNHRHTLNDEKRQHAANMASQLQNYINNFNSVDGSYEEPQYAGSFAPGPWAPSSAHFAANPMWSPGSSGAHPPSLLSHASIPSLHAAQHQHHHHHVIPVKSRGRSSSMLSDVSGFTQSSTGDDDNANGSNNGSSSSNNNTAPYVPPIQTLASAAQSQGHSGPRGPPGVQLSRARKWSDGGSASGSASGSALGSENGVGSGSGSGGSVRDPTSPV
ncbi:Ubiquitination network signaling protein [Pleurostoma richardsiae]|uniref:Ubiquitination network signaling protein n=1 Tax=Pleurostoma richardsiae TaxID=41990 RepID=A0AA38VEI6_9PEZI|nr:Ubiquitination network signaling protein [Pleurostoma richardsiae]